MNAPEFAPVVNFSDMIDTDNETEIVDDYTEDMDHTLESHPDITFDEYWGMR
jgi:hypothetical protein